MQETSLYVHQEHIKDEGSYTASIHEVSIEDKGSVCLEICDCCSYITTVCNHVVNDWNEEGTVLKCRLCGLDGT